MAGIELVRDQGGGYAAMYNANAQAEAARRAAAQNASTRNVNTDSDVALREMALKEQQAAQKNAALAAIAAQLQQSTGYSPAPAATTTPAGPTPDELAAENAGYGRAKERTGLAMQSAMKGLRGAMAGRGISGSGIEADKMGDIFSGGLGDLAETDRTMAEGTASRAFTRNESARDRTESARRYDQDAAARRVSQLISMYGSAY